MEDFDEMMRWALSIITFELESTASFESTKRQM
jgi:hypothetical protein